MTFGNTFIIMGIRTDSAAGVVFHSRSAPADR
jgi:hypothetical protein